MEQLKIFFGYAEGVGKTYAMLKAAHSAKIKGIDVVVGCVDLHSCPQITDLLQGLEVIPAMTVREGDGEKKELDLDAVIARRPSWCWWMRWRTGMPKAAAISSGIRT